MNEITRIHLAKTAYDIEVAAKKQLEKYIKSLENYTQDADVLADIEIRMTELLAERGVAAGGVISTEDIAALRKQLGEPYEFADEESDMALGRDTTSAEHEGGARRLYRSEDNAVLGGVLGGMAAYFNVNPLWFRLGFVVLTFMSFGTALLVYVLFWALTPPARTAAEKLRLAGKRVTVESIKELNTEEDSGERRSAPPLQQILFIGMGLVSAFGAALSLAVTIWTVVAALTLDKDFMNAVNGFTGLGDGYTWLVWLLFWIAVAGMLLLTALLSLISFAFFKKKLTKKMMISGLVIIVLGIASVATVLGVSASQSLRVANESRSLVRETTTQLPKTFASVETVKFVTKRVNLHPHEQSYFPYYTAMRYVVDDGPARYELSALPSARAIVNIQGTAATISLDIPESFRNAFVQPMITVYGPALKTIDVASPEVRYEGQSQQGLSIVSAKNTNIFVSGAFETLQASGAGTVSVDESVIQELVVEADHLLNLTAGTVRKLTVTQPEVCSAYTIQRETRVEVAGVTSQTMHYNGVEMPAETHRTNCAEVVIGESDMLY